MPSINVQLLPRSRARELFAHHALAESCFFSVRDQDLPVVVQSAIKFTRMDEPDFDLLERCLLFVLPPLSEDTLRALASTELTSYNDTSADNLTNTMFHSWKFVGLELRFNAWLLPSFPRGNEFRVAFVSGDLCALSTTIFDESEWEAFLAGCQGLGGSSGPNWNPYKIFSDEEMLEVRGDEDIEDEGCWTAQVI